jgi:hypothetical protein
MVKVFLMLYRKPDLTREQFLDYWKGPHKDLAISTAGAVRLRRYVQNHPVQHEMTEALRKGRGVAAATYDGIVEAWWDSFEDLAAVGNTAGEIAATLLADELRFCDFSRSEMWFGTEHEFFGPNAADRAHEAVRRI